jgi:hypothetical protein
MYILYFMNSATNTVALVSGSKRVEFVTEEGGQTWKLWSIVKKPVSLAQARREIAAYQAKGYRVVAAA